MARSDIEQLSEWRSYALVTIQFMTLKRQRLFVINWKYSHPISVNIDDFSLFFYFTFQHFSLVA